LSFSATIIAEDSDQLIYRSFAPDMDKARQDRSTLDMSREGSSTVFRITAKDAVALRAALNAISSMLAVIEKMMVI
jgi:tRNA threonylcarbamoyladenosine modification (KEOPS) complex  Pcc1 subunit